MNKELYLILSCVLALSLNSCGEDNTTSPQPGDNVKAEFNDIQDKVFTPTCATSGCHAGTQRPDLREGMSYDNLVGVPSIENPDMNRVEPGDSENSLLIKKLLGDNTSRMPSGQPPLESEVIDSIRVWIDNGAERN